MNRFLLELNEVNKATMISVLDANYPELRSQVGQIFALIKNGMEEPKEAQIQQMVDAIVDKIKNLNPLGKEFWDNRKIMQLNYYLSSAIILKTQLVHDEFLEMTVKTIIASLDTFNREPYLEDLFTALEGGKAFPMEYIQKMILQLRELLPVQVKALNKDHLRHWIHNSMASWLLNDEIEAKTRAATIAASHLVPADFGGAIKVHMKPFIQSFVDHYNGDSIFFGLNNRF